MGVNTRFLFTAGLAFFSPNKLKGYVYFSLHVWASEKPNTKFGKRDRIIA